MWWDNTQPQCQKDDYIQEVCSADSSLITDWPNGRRHKICQTVCCGETADFGIGDVTGDDEIGCSDYRATWTTTRAGHKATCHFDNGCSDCDFDDGFCKSHNKGGSGKDCSWKVEVPKCGMMPSIATPAPTWPTPKPSPSPSMKDVEPCDCYTTNIYDDNDKYLLVPGDVGYVEGEEKYKYCYVWAVTQNYKGSEVPTCKQTLIAVELGVCKDPKVDDLANIIVSQTGCLSLEPKYDEELDLNGLYCEIYVDPKYDPNGYRNEIITACLNRPAFNLYPYWREVGYYKQSGDKDKCDDMGLPDLCQTQEPTLFPTVDPTLGPTRSPSKAPTRKPTTSPTFSPTEEPTEDPTFSPTTDPTLSPTTNPIQNPCELGGREMDTIFVVDKSCKSSNDNDDRYCRQRQRMIAEVMTSIKGEDGATAKRIASRVGYLEFGADASNVHVQVPIDDAEFNYGPVTMRNVQDYYNEILGFRCGMFMVPTGHTDLESALEEALDILLGANGRPHAIKKIVVFSECENTPRPDEDNQEKIVDICSDASGGVLDRITSQTHGVDVIFVNLDPDMADDYGSCLASHDVYAPDNVQSVDDVIAMLQDPICDVPTASPTS